MVHAEFSDQQHENKAACLKAAFWMYLVAAVMLTLLGIQSHRSGKSYPGAVYLPMASYTLVTFQLIGRARKGQMWPLSEPPEYAPIYLWSAAPSFGLIWLLTSVPNLPSWVVLLAALLPFGLIQCLFVDIGFPGWQWTRRRSGEQGG
ncbi:hypothetical protein SAMN05421595_2525 [Austwickia chelonae]|uniref:Uncharacterized protein n=1 Tax=Austwickia chelonae NBRC 105200 TaxID=1184607 RepID=K6WBK9_9MICO|nr:hypothetical protein [Austwickia chelonae]GAB79217.1 hypothetical protein AUCHE_21_00430 [Austwickia chelonae NBRC 105200]SEW37317.1 hypothetical protein SAMN05421595_2525 [Austwickia chelonae]